ncbi:MAG: hypothetical protein ACPKQO_04365 [Nitrososphaeraceae archaeon]
MITTIILLILITSILIILGQFFLVFAEPIVHIKPECGSLKDHQITFIANWFKPNSTVHWQIINSNNDIDSFGYFRTNHTGGFTDSTVADDLIPDTYKIKIFDDKDNNYKIDDDGKEFSLEYQIPCM